MEAWFPFLAQGVRFLYWGSNIYWFGPACPAHCQGSLILSCALLVAGFGLGFVACLLLRPLDFCPAPCSGETPTHKGTGPPRHLRFRGCMSQDLDGAIISEVQTALEGLRLATASFCLLIPTAGRSSRPQLLPSFGGSRHPLRLPAQFLRAKVLQPSITG